MLYTPKKNVLLFKGFIIYIIIYADYKMKEPNIKKNNRMF